MGVEPGACGVFYLVFARSAFATTNPRRVARLHTRALKELQLLRGRLASEVFSAAVDRSVAYRFRDTAPDPITVSTHIESLNAADLGLAVMCDAGDEAAWEHVVLTYRPLLYRAAAALAGADDMGHELADSLWAELYGVGHTQSSLKPGVERRSLFRYFHGRSKLSTWLRSVLAQRHIDMVRARRRTESLDVDDPQPEEPGRSSVRHTTTVDATDPDHARYTRMFQQACDRPRPRTLQDARTQGAERTRPAAAQLLLRPVVDTRRNRATPQGARSDRVAETGACTKTDPSGSRAIDERPSPADPERDRPVLSVRRRRWVGGPERGAGPLGSRAQDLRVAPFIR